MHQIQQVSVCPSFSTIPAIAFIQVQRGWQCSLDFREQDGDSVRAMRYELSENIANLWVSCYNGNNDRSARVLFVQQPREQSEWLRQTLGFWLHNSPCSLGCWTNNTLAEPSLSPKYGIIGSDDGLAPNRRQTIIWNNDGLVYWRICASIDLSELKEMILSDYLSIRVATDAILSWGIL